VVKAFHGETREVQRFNRRISELAGSNYYAEAGWATFFPLVTLTMALGTVLIWYVGGRGVIGKYMTIGELMAFLAYMGMLQQPMMMLQRVIDWSTRALTAAERVFEVIDTPVEIEEAPDAVAMPSVKGAVKFKDVHFGYDKAREVIHGIDLEAAPGEMIGLVGHSGAGKSTVINLLMRFYDPTQGHIELDGIDLRRIKLDDYRRQVGVVMQESYLFPGTIRDNIAYGRPEATLEEVLAAAQAANAHSFIVNFPDGYDTYVGERGQRLSGGERQRIAIARAILHNPKVLILDEATASVDTETERMIQGAIENLVEGRTVFAIAHRLSTLRNANRLVVIDDGRIAELGTPEELLAKPDGIYAKLVQMQQEVNTIRSNFIAEE
jgi:ATP-binding cassette subfamily B protein